MRRFLYGLVALGLFLGGTGQARSDVIYWGEYTQIQRANPDGSGQGILVGDLNGPIAIARDLDHGQMYWTSAHDEDIRRANLDGSGETILISGQSNPSGIALDLAGGQMYWANMNIGVDNAGEIWRANLDGSGGTRLLSGLDGPRGIALDLAGGQMYWTEGYGGTISRANLDGTGRKVLVRGVDTPRVLALDLSGGKMYWTNLGTDDIRRANLDGTGQEILVRNLPDPAGIALDVANGRMYWTNTARSVVGMGDIRQANLDGSGQTILFIGLDRPWGIALDLSTLPQSRFQITAAQTAVAGTPFDITVTALDLAGNIDSNYQGTVTFTSSDAYPGLLPADYTFTSSDQGTHTFSGGVTLYTARTQSLTVQDTADSSLTGNATVAVVAAPASQLLIVASANAVSGTPFDVMLTALDPYANVDMNYGGTVTWTSSDTDPGVLLPADYTFQATDNGMVTFSGGVTLITLGNQTLTATDTVSGITGTATVIVGP
jgi:DNA-binding beta-propeller fold protein YncE